MFMGTPEIAIPSLEKLHKKHEICTIVTQADKPRGRGHKLVPTSVAIWGNEHNIDVIKPATFADEAFLPVLKEYNPEVIIVIAYGKILPKYVLDYGTGRQLAFKKSAESREKMSNSPEIAKAINIHFSLLPKYRGAAPVQRAIANGEVETGVCTMLMAEKLDAGDILHTIKTPICKGETSGELFERLGALGAEAIDYTLDNLKSIIPLQQNEQEATYAPMLTKEESFIDFSKTPQEIINHIRAFNPHPVARMVHNGETLKVFSARVNNDGKLEILEIQPPNKAKMLYSDYLRGIKP